MEVHFGEEELKRLENLSEKVSFASLKVNDFRNFRMKYLEEHTFAVTGEEFIYHRYHITVRSDTLKEYLMPRLEQFSNVFGKSRYGELLENIRSFSVGEFSDSF